MQNIRNNVGIFQFRVNKNRVVTLEHKSERVILYEDVISDMKYCLLGEGIHFTVNAGNSFDLRYRLFVRTQRLKCRPDLLFQVSG